MKCIKTGFNVSINGKLYRGNLYINGGKYAVRATKPGRTTYDCEVEAEITGAVIEDDGSNVQVTQYETIKFDHMFAGEVLTASRGHMIPNSLLGIDRKV